MLKEHNGTEFHNIQVGQRHQHDGVGSAVGWKMEPMFYHPPPFVYKFKRGGGNAMKSTTYGLLVTVLPFPSVVGSG